MSTGGIRSLSNVFDDIDLLSDDEDFRQPNDKDDHSIQNNGDDSDRDSELRDDEDKWTLPATPEDALKAFCNSAPGVIEPQSVRPLLTEFGRFQERSTQPIHQITQSDYKKSNPIEITKKRP